MTTDLRQRCYLALQADKGCDPEAIADRCKVLVFAERRPLLGKHDDSIHLITPDGERSWKGNTDPSRVGLNKAIGKNYARLEPGCWPMRTGPHNGRPNNFRQMTVKEADLVGLERYFKDARAQGKYTVRRMADKQNGKLDTGIFNVNLHSSSLYSTSSAGCLTLPPDQWATFQPALYEALGKHGQTWPDGFFVVVLVEAV